MTNAIETELVQSEALTVRERPSMAVGQALSVDDIVAQVALVQNVMRRVMKEGEHYGTIPGCGDKKVLLQPGAQKLCMTFRLCPEYEIQETDLNRGHKEYRVICTLKSMGGGGFVGQGVGCCSSMESKYRWRGGARKCPDCGKETIIKGKAEFGGGWLCWPKKGGCGSKWPDGAEKIEGQNIEKVENDNPADTFNTVLKMAKKRAFVDASITATAASDIFTQDIGDDGDPEPDPAPKRPQDAPKGKTIQPTQKKGAPVDSVPILATVEQRGKLIAVCDAEKDGRWRAEGYFEAIGAISKNGEGLTPLENLPLSYVPRMQSQMRELGLRIAEFHTTNKAERCVWFPTVEPKAPAKPADSAPSQPELVEEDVEWRSFPMPWGKQAGTPLEDLDKKYLYGLWANYEVETEYNGRPKKDETIAKDQLFRDMLDMAGEHYEFDQPKDGA